MLYQLTSIPNPPAIFDGAFMKAWVETPSPSFRDYLLKDEKIKTAYYEDDFGMWLMGDEL